MFSSCLCDRKRVFSNKRLLVNVLSAYGCIVQRMKNKHLFIVMEQHENHLMGNNYQRCLLQNVQVHQSRDNGKLITAHINLHIK